MLLLQQHGDIEQSAMALLEKGIEHFEKEVRESQERRDARIAREVKTAKKARAAVINRFDMQVDRSHEKGHRPIMNTDVKVRQGRGKGAVVRRGCCSSSRVLW